MNRYEQVRANLKQAPKAWLLTGVAGFIGSNLLETLLQLDQHVIGLDNLSTGHRYNLDDVKQKVSGTQWRNFVFTEEDISDLKTCMQVMQGVNHVLHQAAQCSVEHSMDAPIHTHHTNVSGFLNVLSAAKENRQALSPYVPTKRCDELYADVFNLAYQFKATGLRYFNVFGPRQDPNGAYAAVIPKWCQAMLDNEPLYINGNDRISRDFCFIGDVIQANLLAATAPQAARGDIYNVALGGCTSLKVLFDTLKTISEKHHVYYALDPVYRDARSGDIEQSWADISKIKQNLGYEPLYTVFDGLEKTIAWYHASLGMNVSGVQV